MAEHPPCPFCGSMDIRILGPTCTKTSPYNPADRAFPIARCHSCHVDVPGEDWDNLGMSAVNAWNRRAALTEPEGR